MRTASPSFPVRAGRGPATVADPAGEEFDFDAAAEVRRRLPRLAALYQPA
jgi:hypothetical protein